MKTKSITSFAAALLLLATLGIPVANTFAQGTAFTYQGQLYDGASLANGLYDLRFHLYSASSGGTLVAGPITNAPVTVSNGLFVVTLDFGAAGYTGQTLWLQIGARSNGQAVAYTSLSPRQQLTPTPYSIFAEGANAAGLTGTIPGGDLGGTYSGAMTLNNTGNIFDGTFIGSGIGLTGVALLAGGNTFSGNQTINNSILETGHGSGAGSHTDVIIGPGGYYPGEEHRIDFDDSSSPIGSLILGYDTSGVGYFSVGNLYNGTYQSGTKGLTVFGNSTVGVGTTGAPQQYLSVHGGLNIDQANLNAGFLNNGNTNGYGISFGSNSGEGIASERVAGANQYGLDFYTSFNQRMSLNNSGNLILDGNDMYLLPGNTWNGLGYRSSVAGVSPSGGEGIFLYGLEAGYLGTRDPDAVALWWDWHNNVGVTGEYFVVNGLTPVYAYIGDDGSGNDVQIGSQKSGVTALAAYNTADNAYMHFYCSSITIKGGSDLAEPFKITSGDSDVPQGAVVVIDDQNPGHLKLSDQSYDTRVAGVISGANGINPGIQMQQQGLLEDGKNVALTGRVYVQADTMNGPIKPGDLLTTSSSPGHAMKVTDHARAAGAILGKAMTGLSEGQGMVLVLVTLQ